MYLREKLADINRRSLVGYDKFSIIFDESILRNDVRSESEQYFQTESEESDSVYEDNSINNVPRRSRRKRKYQRYSLQEDLQILADIINANENSERLATRLINSYSRLSNT